MIINIISYRLVLFILIVTMPSCAMQNCKNNSQNTKNKKISFFTFPKETEIIERWKLVCKENVNPKIARVCSEHFHHLQFEDKSWLKDLIGESGNVRVKLKRDAVPLAAIEDKKISMDNHLEADVAQPIAHCSFNSGTDCAGSTFASSCATQAVLNTAMVSNFDISQEMQKLQHRNTALLLETKTLRLETKALHLEIKALKRRLASKDKLHKKQLTQKMQEKLTLFFTPGQIKILLNPTQKKTRWTKEDIAAAISLKNVSPEAYRHLRKTKQLPLPAMSTLRKWITNQRVKKIDKFTNCKVITL